MPEPVDGEHWSFNYQNRVFSTPIINLSEVDTAQRELEYVLANGAKVALIKPGPVNGLRGWRSPALPEFDPFWRDVGKTAGFPIVLHASYPPLDSYVNTWEPPHTQNFMAMRRIPVDGAGPPRDRRHAHQPDLPRHLDPVPELRIASVENGSGWIFPLFNDFEDLPEEDAAEFPRASARGVPPQRLGLAVLGAVSPTW